MNWIITILVKAVLEWLTSLLVRLRELEEKKQEGRQEVIKAIDESNKKAEDELKKLGETYSNTTDDDLARRLRDGYERERKKDVSNR